MDDYGFDESDDEFQDIQSQRISESKGDKDEKKEETKHISEVEHKSDLSPQEHQYSYNQNWNQGNMEAMNNYYKQTRMNDPYMMMPKQEEKNRMNDNDHHIEQREHKTVYQNIGYIKDIK